MPKGLQGQKRPGDMIGTSVMVAKIATGEIEDNAKSGWVNSGRAGGEAHTEKLSSDERNEIARRAADARWG